MERDDIRGPFESGKWTAWLRGLSVGEEQVRELDPGMVPRVRTCARRLEGFGYRFTVSTRKGRLYVKREYPDFDAESGEATGADFGLDSYLEGNWTDWLRGFSVGESRMEVPDRKKTRSIRVTASMLRDSGYYFTTAMVRMSSGEERLMVTRLTKEEWERSPRRR